MFWVTHGNKFSFHNNFNCGIGNLALSKTVKSNGFWGTKSNISTESTTNRVISEILQ